MVNTGQLVTASVLVLACSLRTPDLQAQAPPQGQAAPASAELRFEAASIKPNNKTFEEHFLRQGSGEPAFSGVRTLPGGRLQASYATIRPLIGRAFELRPYQLEGGPAWLESDKYDINATAGREATPAEFNAMLRSLLAERFKLRTRVVTKQAPTYVMSLARSDRRLGPGIKPASADCVATVARRQAEGPGAARPPIPLEPDAAPMCGSNIMGVGKMGGRRMSMGGTALSTLIMFLTAEVDAPIEDRTGLPERYDIVIEFHSTVTERLQGLRTSGDTPTAPALRDALRDQLGLSLEKTTGPLPITVIESIERPTPD